MTDLQEKLFALRDEKYAAFQCKLMPTVAPEKIIGVRMPLLHRVAKEWYKEGTYEPFLSQTPHRYYEEDLLHGFLLSSEKDYAVCLRRADAFLPFVDNWAVCDTLSPTVFRKHKSELIAVIPGWIASDAPYTCRFGIEMLMSHFLDEDFSPEYLALPAKVDSDEYYVKMMVAWFFATALAKQWNDTVPYLEQHRLPDWVHRKTIQKACESYRITAEQKAYLRTLK